MTDIVDAPSQLDWGDNALHRQIRELVDLRVNAILRENLPKKRYGEVVAQRGRAVSVLLDGLDDATPGVWLGGTAPRVRDNTKGISGMRVRVLSWPNDESYVDDVVDEFVASTGSVVVIPAPEDKPLTLGELDALGLATDKALSDHADNSPQHNIAMMTHNTGTTDQNKWSQLADGKIALRYGQMAGAFILNGNGATTAIWTRGLVRFRIKQQADFGANPVAKIELINAVDITTSDIVLVVTSNGGPTTFEIHARVSRQNEWLEWQPLTLSRNNATLTWTPCPPFVASLPAGTQFVAV